MDNMATKIPAKKMLPDNPFLYKTNTKEKKTRADPISGWSKMSRTGATTIMAAEASDFMLLILRCFALRYLASASPVANFTNSEG